MTFPTAIRRLVSGAAATLLLAGCAQHVAERTASVPPAPPIRSVPSAPCGAIATRPGRAGMIVAAPGGPADVRTDQIAAEIARRTGFGLVVEDSRPACGGYEQRVREVAQGPLRFYAEIYGTNQRESASRIEIATVGVDREYAARLRTLAELIRDAYLRGHAGAPRLDVLVAPADTVRGDAARRDGVLRLPERALQIELPRVARIEFRELYTAILSDFLAQAVTLPVGR